MSNENFSNMPSSFYYVSGRYIKYFNVCPLGLEKIRNRIFFTLETTWTDHASDYLLQKRRSINFIKHFFSFWASFFEQNVYNSNTNNNENWFEALQDILYFVTRNYVTKSSTLIRLLILKSLKNKKANILHTTIIKYMSEGKCFIFICNTNFVLCYTKILTSCTSYPPWIYEMVLWKK